MLVPEHFGFWKGISTENAAFILADSMLKSIKQKMHVGGIFLDLAEVCDFVNYEMMKLNYIFMAFNYQLEIG
jgi:hypothetical protein